MAHNQRVVRHETWRPSPVFYRPECPTFDRTDLPRRSWREWLDTPLPGSFGFSATLQLRPPRTKVNGRIYRAVVNAEMAC